MSQTPSNDAQNTSWQERASANPPFNIDPIGNGSLHSPEPDSHASTIMAQDKTPTQALLQPVPPLRHKGKDTTIIVSILAILLTISGAVFGTAAYNNNRSAIIARATAQAHIQQTATTLANATATALAIATTYPFSVNLKLDDPLTDNSKGVQWQTTDFCKFMGSAYHVIDPQTNT